MGLHCYFLGRTITACRKLMRCFGSVQGILLVLSVLSVCACGLNVDLHGLKQLRRSYILDKRTEVGGAGNPCPVFKPFLCKSSSACIALKAVCDDYPDCPDHFDEDKELCNAKRRPSVDSINKLLELNSKWMLQSLFSGADIELVSHALAVGTDLRDVSLMVGLTPDAEKALQEVFEGVLQNDIRPLLKLGMPKGEWSDTKAILKQIVDGGLAV